MHNTRRRYLAAGRVAINVLAFLTVVGLTERPVGAHVLSFEDWLDAQSTRCKDYDGDGTPCEPYTGQPLADQYIPANQSYLYFTAPAEERVAVVDWLGKSGRYLRDVCGVDLGTTTRGSVNVHRAENGQVLVIVQGRTQNAMAFVVEDPGLNPFSLPLLSARAKRTYVAVPRPHWSTSPSRLSTTPMPPIRSSTISTSAIPPAPADSLMIPFNSTVY